MEPYTTDTPMTATDGNAPVHAELSADNAPYTMAVPYSTEPATAAYPVESGLVILMAVGLLCGILLSRTLFRRM